MRPPCARRVAEPSATLRGVARPRCRHAGQFAPAFFATPWLFAWLERFTPSRCTISVGVSDALTRPHRTFVL